MRIHLADKNCERSCAHKRMSRLLLENMNPEGLLKFAIEHGMIDTSYVQEQIEMSKREELLKNTRILYIR